MLVDKQSELMSDLFLIVHQHGGDDVTWKPPVPSEWKDARVTPIFKSGARNNCFE